MKYAFPRPQKFKTIVKKSKAGLGLYAGENIPKNRFIIEYWGKLVTDEEAEKICGKYLFELGNGKTIDGTTRENTARYANHSCRPNAEVRIASSRVFIHAIKPIKAGDEIVYDYGKEYFNHFIKPHGCRCVKCTTIKPCKTPTTKPKQKERAS